ncbi:MAG: TraR/DksA family transcriptional regulator [Candidatus Paceibacterota bacterium]|jgi:RNA polymerase-binding transcription factor DksA
MNKKETEQFKQKLLAEMAIIEGELSSIGHKNPQVVGGWEATSGDMEVNSADENEMADKFEELEDNKSIVVQLENQLLDIKSALERIEKGTYGICEVCGVPIEKERLEANPSSKVSIKHGH